MSLSLPLCALRPSPALLCAQGALTKLKHLLFEHRKRSGWSIEELVRSRAEVREASLWFGDGSPFGERRARMLEYCPPICDSTHASYHPWGVILNAGASPGTGGGPAGGGGARGFRAGGGEREAEEEGPLAGRNGQQVGGHGRSSAGGPRCPAARCRGGRGTAERA